MEETRISNPNPHHLYLINLSININNLINLSININILVRVILVSVFIIFNVVTLIIKRYYLYH